MYETKKTIFYSQLEAQRLLRNGFTPMEHSTLNELFDVALEETLPSDAYPDMHYVAIGRGGHRGRLTANNATVVDILEHDPTDAALFEHIPFIVRPVAEDLDPVDRANYAMRTIIQGKDGKPYMAYYLKAVDMARGYPETKIIKVKSDTIEETIFVPTPAMLTPTPLELAVTRANAASGTHINVASTMEFELTQNDVAEIINACMIIYGDISYATISEMANVTAIPKEYTSTLGVTEVTYIEAMSAQIAFHVPSNISLQFTTNGIIVQFSAGHTSAMVRVPQTTASGTFQSLPPTSV